jgi:magnesium chelatase subunit D
MTLDTRVMPQVVGLRREREVLTVALEAGRHVVLEGPPGTGKSTLLRHIARDLGTQVVFVEGNAELTPARLIGQYDPAQVLAEGYVAASFTDGPLLQAMRAGALLYLEEFNRVPEETLNVLITVLTEGEIAVPRLGMVSADPGFRLIAAMNPFDAIGTARVSHAIADRICRVVLGYQDANAERRITTVQTGLEGLDVDFAVTLTRSTREHPDVRMGSSVRGAIDLVLLLTGLTRLRREDTLMRETARDAVHAALSGRIRIADGCVRPPESVLDELLDKLWPADAPAPRLPVPGQDENAPDGRGKADGPPPGAGLNESRSSLRRDRQGGSTRRTISRAELASQHPSFPEVSPQPGIADEDALAALLATDPDAAARLLADLTRASDPQLRAAARRLAARVFVQLAAVGQHRSRGVRRIGPGRADDGDLDLERTLGRMSGTWPPAADEIATRAWRARQRSIVLAVDCSGSMSGLALAMAAIAAAGVVLAGDSRLEPAVLAFSGSVTVLQERGVRRPPQDVISGLIALRAHGRRPLSWPARPVTARSSCCRTASPRRAAIPPRRWPGSTGCTCFCPCRRPNPSRPESIWPGRAAGSASPSHHLPTSGPR